MRDRVFHQRLKNELGNDEVVPLRIDLDPVTFILEDGSIAVVESELSQLQISVNLYMKDKTEQ